MSFCKICGHANLSDGTGLSYQPLHHSIAKVATKHVMTVLPNGKKELSTQDALVSPRERREAAWLYVTCATLATGLYRTHIQTLFRYATGLLATGEAMLADEPASPAIVVCEVASLPLLGRLCCLGRRTNLSHLGRSQEQNTVALEIIQEAVQGYIS